MTRPLTWTETLHYDDYETTYVAAKELVAYDGPHKIATVVIGFGSHNSANSARGSIAWAEARGKFRKYWGRKGYTWRGDYVPALPLSDIDVPKKWVEERWALWLEKQSSK